MQIGMKLNDAGRELNLSPYRVKKNIKLGKLTEIAGASPRMVTTDSVIRLRDEMQRAATSEPELTTPFIPGLFQKSIRVIDFRGGYNKTLDNHPEKYLSNMLIGVTEDGYVVNLTTRRPLSVQLADHDYRQVGLTNANKQRVFLMLHRLVAFAWCPNRRFAPEVHRVDKDIANNTARNLIWLFAQEHRKAHELLDAAKKSGDYTEYNDYIQSLRELNEWTPTQRERGICWVIDNDGTDSVYLLWITEAAYMSILDGKAIDDLSAEDVYLEYTDCRPPKKINNLSEVMEE